MLDEIFDCLRSSFSMDASFLSIDYGKKVLKLSSSFGLCYSLMHQKKLKKS